ncbi:MAG TPA: phosphatase PAP2 family protein [Pseudonocardiaceae bacterium]
MTRRMLITALVAVLVLVATYVGLVLTSGGQRFENGALAGAEQVDPTDKANALTSLARISVYSLAVAVALVFVIGLVRRRVDLAIAGVGVVAVALGITEVLKHYVLVRPELIAHDPSIAHNSFPSGHTTIAMSVLFGLLIVVPYRWRGFTLFFTVFYAVGIGEETVIAQWHRLSDTIGGDMVALAVGCVAMAVVARRSGFSRVPRRRFSPRLIFVVLPVAIAAVGALVLGAIFVFLALPRNQVGTGDYDWIAYLTAQTLASGFSGLTALVYLGLLRRVSLGSTPSEQPQEAVLADR